MDPTSLKNFGYGLLAIGVAVIVSYHTDEYLKTGHIGQFSAIATSVCLAFIYTGIFLIAKAKKKSDQSKAQD